MDFCTNCGNKLAQDTVFCGVCGTKTGIGTASSAAQPPMAAHTYAPMQRQPKKKFLIVSALAVIIIVVVAVVLFAMSRPSLSGTYELRFRDGSWTEIITLTFTGNDVIFNESSTSLAWETQQPVETIDTFSITDDRIEFVWNDTSPFDNRRTVDVVNFTQTENTLTLVWSGGGSSQFIRVG